MLFYLQRSWRKNRSKSEDSHCIGVDINRNFGFQWGGNSVNYQLAENYIFILKYKIFPRKDKIF